MPFDRHAVAAPAAVTGELGAGWGEGAGVWAPISGKCDVQRFGDGRCRLGLFASVT